MVRNAKGNSAMTAKYRSHKYDRKRIRRTIAKYGKYAFLNSAQ
jgi:hypothetical protein